MNSTSSGSMTLEKAIQGFIQAKQTEGCRDNTIVTYIRTDYEPRRLNGPQRHQAHGFTRQPS